MKLHAVRRLIEAFVTLMVGARISVRWGAQAGVSDDGQLHLPAPKTGEAAEFALLTRLAVHEAGHVVHTQRGWSERLSDEERPLFNALEDARMERAQCADYPGAAIVLARGLDEMLQEIGQHAAAYVATRPDVAMQIDLLVRGFLLLAPHEAVRRHADALLAAVAPVITTVQRQAMDAVLAKLPAAASSLHIEALARELTARLRQELPSAMEQPTPASDSAEQNEPVDGGRASSPPESGARHQREPETGAVQAQQTGDDATGAGAGLEQEPDASAAGSGSPQRQAPAPSDGAAGDGGCATTGDGALVPAQDHPVQLPHHGSGDALSPRSEAQSEDPPSAPTQQKQHQGVPTPENGDAGDAGIAGRRIDANGVGDDGGGAPAAAPSTSNAPSDSVDLGALLRTALAARDQPPAPGNDDVDECDAAPASDDEVASVAAILSRAEPTETLEQLLEQSIAVLEPQLSGADGGGPHGHSGGIHLAAPPAWTAAHEDTRLEGVQSQLVTLLRRVLQDKRPRSGRLAQAGASVRPDRYWRLAALGDTRIMGRKRLGGGIDAAATVLLDCSDSMELQLMAAARAALAFSLALQRLGVTTRVARFPGATSVTQTIQRFGEGARVCLDRCAQLQASGGTPTGAALAVEMVDLLAQRRLKKVMVVITDDGPADPVLLAAALARAAQCNILVVGVGMGCDIRELIPHSVRIEGAAELPDALRTLFDREMCRELLA